MNYIDLDTITGEAFVKVHELDQTFINTPNYLGVAYFWNYEYRHYLREASTTQRKEVHKLFRQFEIGIDKASYLHLEIINHVLKRIN